jgi:hypothetical protein
MPRLGGNDPLRPSSPGGTGGRRRSQFPALLQNPPVQLNLRNVLLGLAVLFILRNFLRNDYRKEEIQYLRASGMTEEQIERYIPKTAAERRKYVEAKANDLEQMKKDIAYLLNEVSEIKAGAGMANNSHLHGDGRDESLSNMDKVHAEKRRHKEEQLLKDHPNFKPGKRLRDTMAEETKAQ